MELIWWLSQADCTAIGEELPGRFPDYLQSEYRSRFGRPGRGRLWVPMGFPNVSVDPWPDSPLAKYVESQCGGLVFSLMDLFLFEEMPGIITTLKLRRI